MRSGNLPAAQTEAEQGFARYAQKDPMWAGRFRLLEAEVLVYEAQNQRAVELLHGDLKPSSDHDAEEVKRQALLAISYFRLGSAREADAQLGRADALCPNAECDAGFDLANAHGVIAVDQGRLVDAERWFRRSLQTARQKQDLYEQAAALANLGVVELQQEHYDAALDWLKSAQQLAHAVGAAVVEEKALGNLGWAYYSMGDFDKAEELFVEAEQRARQLGSNRDQVEWLNTLGLVYYQKNQLAKAEEHYRKSLEVARKIQDPVELTGALSTLAFISELKGDLDQAQQYCEQAFALTQQTGDVTAALLPQLVQGEIYAQRGQFSEAEKRFLQLEQDPQSDLSERWEAKNSLARLYDQQHRTAEAEKKYRDALATIEAARETLQEEAVRLPFMANATHLYDDYLDFLLRQGRTVEALQLADYSRARTLAEGLRTVRKEQSSSARQINPQQVARSLKATVLFYWLGPKHSYLWIVTPSRVQQVSLVPTAEIDQLVARYRRNVVSGRDPLATRDPTATELFNLVVGPAAQLISPGTRVIVLADGSLNTLNFETLLVPDPRPHYWIEDVAVINGNSLRLLASTVARNPRQPDRLLVMGDPVAPGAEYGSLPQAGAEIQDVAQHFPPDRRLVFSGAQATPSAYLASKPEQFSYIHFVAHGTASRLSPLDSAVVLSKATAEEDSFKLYARDIIQRPLHAQLVTISTCFGAGSRAYSGEGLVGLSWAFLRAGAHNVIGALWEVSDTSTPQLMNAMYSNLQQGERPEEALRQAKLSLLHSDGVYRKPFYWAPFQLYTGS